MRSIRMVGLAIVAVLAFSAIAATGANAETKFVASKTGKLAGKALNTQKFKTGSGATVECTKAAPAGEVTALEATEQAVSVTYSSCSVLSIGSATVSLADYTFFIPLLVSVLKSITITAEALGVKCELLVLPGQSLGATTGELELVNKSGKIEDKNKVTKIITTIKKSNSTSLCGTEGAEVENGEYTGNDEIELEGGTIETK